MINLNNFFIKYTANIVWDITYTKNLIFIYLNSNINGCPGEFLFGFAKSGSLRKRTRMFIGVYF